MKIKISLFISVLIAIFHISFAQSPITPGLHTETVKFGGLDRKYMYYIPKGYDEKAKLPVVFFLHGMGASAQIGEIHRLYFYHRLKRNSSFDTASLYTAKLLKLE